jgi:hypothetical protein
MAWSKQPKHNRTSIYTTDGTITTYTAILALHKCMLVYLGTPIKGVSSPASRSRGNPHSTHNGHTSVQQVAK